MAIGVPGWPELAACTASIDRVRIVVIAVWMIGSLSVFSMVVAPRVAARCRAPRPCQAASGLTLLRRRRGRNKKMSKRLRGPPRPCSPPGSSGSLLSTQGLTPDVDRRGELTGVGRDDPERNRDEAVALVLGHRLVLRDPPL